MSAPVVSRRKATPNEMATMSQWQSFNVQFTTGMIAIFP
jgi:hypothetical protein